MSGSLAHQVGLVACLERYERKERIACWFPMLSEQGREADAAHAAMFEAAILCGFRPGRQDGGITCLDWSRKRVATTLRMFPANVAEQRRGH